MAMTVGEFFMKLGFDVDSKPIENFTTKVDGLKDGLFGLKEYAIAAAYAVSKFVESSVRKGADLTTFNNVTGESIEQLQKWQSVASQVDLNLNPQKVQAYVMALSKSLNLMNNFGQGDRNAFISLGVNSRAGLFEVLKQIAAAKKNFDNQTFSNLIERIGLTGELNSVLNLTNEEFEKLAKNYTLTEGQSSSLNHLGLELNKVAIEFGYLQDTLLSKYEPQIKSSIKVTMEFVNQFENVIGKLFEFLSQYPNMTKGFAIIAAGLASLSGPIGLLAGSLTLLVGALNELEKWSNGEKNLFSDTGNLLDKYALPVVNKLLSDSLGVHLEKRNGILDPMGKNYGGNGPESKTVNNNMSNVFNLHSTADSKIVAKDIFQEFKNAYQQRNMGAVN